MTRLQLFRLLLRNIRISNRRSVLRDTNRAATVFTFIGVGFVCIYLIVLGAALGLAAAEDGENVISIVMFPVLLMDFFMRVGMQQTPSMLLKPYLLMPVRRSYVIDCFLLTTFANANSLVWLALFLPYSFITVCGGTGLFTALAVLFTCQLLISINGLWYLVVRTLATRNVLWWALPVVVYGGIGGLTLLVGLPDALDMCFCYSFTPVSISVYVLLLAGLFAIARRIVGRFSYEETAKTDNVKMKTVSQFTFLNRYGLIGEYLKLEIKSTMRNKTVRSRFLQSISVITLLSLILAYTDVYDARYSGNAWCLYCFALIGVTNLSWLMGAEGNYIDLLMVHDENIYTLLKAKYYFYCAVLLLPALILLPTVISGKYSVMMILAYVFMTSGVEYFLLFQLSVYNRQAMPLNARITGRGNAGNALQITTSVVVLVLPMIMALTVTTVFGETVGYAILTVIGLAFSLTNSLWLRNIYRRMMNRRHANIEGFHETR